MEPIKRVIYDRSPLVEVILQIKFPTILSINANEPVSFQDAIRQEYPIYQLAVENEQEITLPVATAGKEALIPSIVQRQQHKNHNFISEDGKYKINLTSGFISISTLGYTRWEDMLGRFETPFKKFLELYRPPFLERIGLRYIDSFSRKKLEISDKKWSDLIQPMWLGAMATIDEQQVIGGGIDIEYFLDDGISRAKVHAGLGNIGNDPEQVFIIDSDFIHIKNLKIENFESVVNYLHNNAGKLVRMVITETLHQSMIPRDIS